MLESDAVKNLRYDSEIRVAQQPRVEPTVFNGPTNITSAPRMPLGSSLPLSISTVELGSTFRTYIPAKGYDALYDTPSVHIEQTFELNPYLTAVESENRYTVRTPNGEAIFAATESSKAKDRSLWGASRPMQLHLFDKTHQEALVLHKNLALGICCCQPKSIEICAATGGLLGRIVEKLSLLTPQFEIQNEKGIKLYRLEGPELFCGGCFFKPKEAYFQIFGEGSCNLKGSITRRWSTESSQYVMNIFFNDIDLDVNSKALFLGAGFLLEYMYFQ